MKIKFKTRSTGELKNPVFVIGINPGRPGRGQPHLTWTGPRGASLVQQASQNLKNLYFTNVFNWYVHPRKGLKKLIKEGLEELKRDINRYRPGKIVCFGNEAFSYIEDLHLYETTLVKLPHPSYVYRFLPNQRHQYVQRLRKELT